MTEGLAVVQEAKPLRWEWVPMLYRAVADDTLFSLDELTWAFIRPKKPSDRSMAYAQSYWVCRYIQQAYGDAAILRLFELFRQGQGQEQAIPTVTGVSVVEFEAGFRRWAVRQTAAWGYDPQTSATVEQLTGRAQQLVDDRDYAAAIDAWLEVLTLRPMDALPRRRLAGLYMAQGVNRPADAIAQLKVLHQVELNDNRYARQIVRLARQIGDTPLAIDFARQAVNIDPYSLEAQQTLLELLDDPTNGTERQQVQARVQAIRAMKPD
jgi:tetratricopeptide (TPR) repeat protein